MSTGFGLADDYDALPDGDLSASMAMRCCCLGLPTVPCGLTVEYESKQAGGSKCGFPALDGSSRFFGTKTCTMTVSYTSTRTAGDHTPMPVGVSFSDPGCYQYDATIEATTDASFGATFVFTVGNRIATQFPSESTGDGTCGTTTLDGESPPGSGSIAPSTAEVDMSASNTQTYTYCGGDVLNASSIGSFSQSFSSCTLGPGQPFSVVFAGASGSPDCTTTDTDGISTSFCPGFLDYGDPTLCAGEASLDWTYSENSADPSSPGFTGVLPDHAGLARSLSVGDSSSADDGESTCDASYEATESYSLDLGAEIDTAELIDTVTGWLGDWVAGGVGSATAQLSETEVSYYASTARYRWNTGIGDTGTSCHGTIDWTITTYNANGSIAGTSTGSIDIDTDEAYTSEWVEIFVPDQGQSSYLSWTWTPA